MSRDILVSVIIPCYNNSKVIERSIQSVLDQAHSTIEIIVVNDGSTDSSSTVIRNLRDRRIRLINLRDNVGVANARNIGLDSASGEWIQFLDADDIIYQDKIYHQLEISGNVDIVVSGSEDIHENGDRVQYSFPTNDVEISIVDYLYKNPFPIHAPLVRASLLGDTQRFNSEIFHEDWEFWVRLLSLSPLVRFSPRIGCAYLRSQGSKSFNKIVNLERQIDCLDYIKRQHYALNIALQGHIEKSQNNIRYRLSIEHFKRGDVDKGSHYYNSIRAALSPSELLDIYLAKSKYLRRMQGKLPGPKKVLRWSKAILDLNHKNGI